MPNLDMIIVGYLVIVNLWGFISMALDKQKAIKHQYRTPEKHLWLIAWMGGAPGSLLGMKTQHHKTRTNVFRFGMPILCVGHVLLWGFIFLHI